MENYLKALRMKRKHVEVAIDQEYSRPYPCAFELSRLKRVKLQLRDNIRAIESNMATAGHRLPVRAPLGFHSML